MNSCTELDSSLDGKIISDGEISEAKQGENAMNFELDNVSNQVVIITFIFDNKFYFPYTFSACG